MIHLVEMAPIEWVVGVNRVVTHAGGWYVRGGTPHNNIANILYVAGNVKSGRKYDFTQKEFYDN